jgi:branched-chain amino acid transport system permease protein
VTSFLAYSVIGIATGCIYALTASGLVVTYTTSGIFNFAHGAIGMLMAFTYWQLTVQNDWPQWLALIVVLGLIAPALGALIQRGLMSRLYGSSISTTLVITLGLLLSCIGVATILWDPGEPRSMPEFFAGNSVKVFSIFVSYHQLTMMSVAVLVAVFLRLFLFRTRIGTAMRAVVDDPELAALNGAAPERVAAVSWALGASLAGLAGILLAPLVSLDIILLTLLVINGYAAAMVGRLRSLPLTFVGGLALGLAEAHTIGNLPTNILNIVKPALPIIFLYAVLLILPQARLRVGRIVTTKRAPRVASLRESLVAGAGFMVLAAVLTQVLSETDLFTLGQGIVYALIMLSLVLLTGYGGQVSLAQMTFVGIGAFAMGKFFDGSVLGIVAAAVLAGIAGALAALPAIRLQGLYLALSTLAFAQGMSALFFKNQNVFGYGGRLEVKRPDILGLSFRGDKAFFMLVCFAFAACGIGVLALRRGPFGRRLVAMRESPAACATLGLSLTMTKLAVFSLSSAMAGLAGAFYGGLRGQVGLNDFEMLQSLVLLLLVSVAGINTVTGALMGGVTFGLFPKIQRALPDVKALSFLGAGFGAIALGRNPNGWTSDVGPNVAKAREALRGVRTKAPEVEVAPNA